MATAQIDFDDSDYVWRDLNADSLDRSAPLDLGVETTANDLDIAIHNTQAMQELTQPSHPAVQLLAFDLAMNQRIAASEAKAYIARLLAAHAEEWRAFVGNLAPTSWVREASGLVP